jgi:hypothetical protein
MELVMASNGGERAGGVVHRSDNETGAGTGAAGRVDAADAKKGGETLQAPKPGPVEFSWDFPFDFPRPKR